MHLLDSIDVKQQDVAQLGKADVIVDLASGRHVMLDDSFLGDRESVTGGLIRRYTELSSGSVVSERKLFTDRFLMGHERGLEDGQLVLLEDLLFEHLRQHGVVRFVARQVVQTAHALVLSCEDITLKEKNLTDI